MSASTLDMLKRAALPKGDVLTTAKIAGVMAAKRTAELIPMCHPLALSYVDVRFTVRDSGRGIAPSSSVLNLNATWENVASMPVDLSFFMTNVTNEHVIQQINDNQARGFVSAIVGEPRMWGARLRYRFGS